MPKLDAIWRYVVQPGGDYEGLLSGANYVYSYYNRRSSSFAPGGIRDYEIPVVDTPILPGSGPGAATTTGAFLPAILGTADRIGSVLGGSSGSASAFPTDIPPPDATFSDEEEPQPDPESIYANLPPLNPEWQDVDVFGDSENDFEEETPPAFIPITAGAGEPDPWEPGPAPPPVDEEEPMPSFWDFVNPIIDVAQGQTPGGQNFVGGPYAAPPGMVNAPVQINPRTGRPMCKRRRRRRLLTESDFNDLMRIATLPNKQNVTVALAKAVGRR